MIASCNEASPPIADEMIAPIRPAFASVICKSDCASASFAEAIVNCSKRSRRRASFASIYFSGVKPFTSAAMCTCNGDESNCVIGPTPETPSIKFFQDSATLKPSGFTVPMPVTTILSCIYDASKNFVDLLALHNTPNKRTSHAGRKARFTPDLKPASPQFSFSTSDRNCGPNSAL